MSGETKILVEQLPELLCWLKDINWPGATDIANFISSFEDQLINPIRNVLDSGDLIWCKWVLRSFSDRFDAKFWIPLTSELQSLAMNNDNEGACIEALYILWKSNLCENDWAKGCLNKIQSNNAYDVEDLNRFQKLL